ncbi:MAG: DUF4097 domain-containing protein [bacterium]|nr:DUF4097 domain-containing protein [bacterium]
MIARGTAGFAVAALFLSMLSAGADGQATSHELPVDPGQELRVELSTGGTVTIEGWDRDLLSVEADLRGPDADNVLFQVEKTRSGAEILGEFKQPREKQSTSLNLRVRVPRSFDLTIESRGGGIEIDNVSGRIRGKTMGGSLELRRLEGRLDLRTMGGNISLEDSAVDGEVETYGGNVRLRNVDGDVEAKSLGGEVIYDNVHTNGKGGGPGREVKISTLGGDIEVPSAPLGADLSTLGGSIVVEHAGEYVRAKTLGGNIEIGAVDGWVKASTMAGDIDVTMIGDAGATRRDAQLTTSAGDVRLAVPEGLSMEIDVTIAFTKRGRRDYTIDSDFPLEIRSSESWEYHEGEPRKYVYGKATIGGGRHKIKIETINGDVVLKRTE